MKEKMKISYRIRLILLGILGLLIVASAFGYYVFKFGRHVLVDHDKWGQFGDFLGGTTNPLLALLTFLGVLWTISLTHDERKDQQIQDEKSDLYRIVQTINDDLTALMNSKLLSHVLVVNNVFVAEQYVSFSDLLKMNKREVRWSDLKTNYSSHLLDISVQLGNLRYYLLQYEKLASNRIVSDYYRIYYMLACFQLQDLELLNSSTMEFFKDSKNEIIQDEIRAKSHPDVAKTDS